MRESLYKAISKESNKLLEGSLIIQRKTTYCVALDYAHDPNNTLCFIAYDRMTDWGLPNNHYVEEVYPETVCEAVDGLFGYIEHNGRRFKRQLFEGDIVNILRGTEYFENFVLEYSKENLCWVAVPKDKDKPLKQIKLNADWHFDYLGNIKEQSICSEDERKGTNESNSKAL